MQSMKKINVDDWRKVPDKYVGFAHGWCADYMLIRYYKDGFFEELGCIYHKNVGHKLFYGGHPAGVYGFFRGLLQRKEYWERVYSVLKDKADDETITYLLCQILGNP